MAAHANPTTCAAIQYAGTSLAVAALGYGAAANPASAASELMAHADKARLVALSLREADSMGIWFPNQNLPTNAVRQFQARMSSTYRVCLAPSCPIHWCSRNDDQD